MNFTTEDLRVARWNFLLALNVGGRQGVGAHIFQRVAKETNLQLTADQVREVVHYLAGLGLCSVSESGLTGTWHAKITPLGTDVVNYDSECPPSIARPEQKWF